MVEYSLQYYIVKIRDNEQIVEGNYPVSQKSNAEECLSALEKEKKESFVIKGKIVPVKRFHIDG